MTKKIKQLKTKQLASLLAIALIAAGSFAPHYAMAQGAPAQQQPPTQQPAPTGPAGLPQMGDEFRNSSYPEAFSANTFYPGTELRAVPVARARVVAARAGFHSAENGLTNAVEDVRRAFKRSDELKQAQAEERQAWAELQDAQNVALADLKKDANYQAAQILRQKLSDQLERRREADPVTGGGSTEEIVAIATVKLTFSATASAMEAAAISADARVKEARQRLVHAGERLAELRQMFDEAVRHSPQVLAARQNLDQSRTYALAAEAFYIEANANRIWATNYADWQSRDRGSAYYYPYSNYGGYYDSSYTGGYQFGYPNQWPWQSTVVRNPMPR